MPNLYNGQRRWCFQLLTVEWSQVVCTWLGDSCMGLSIQSVLSK